MSERYLLVVVALVLVGRLIANRAFYRLDAADRQKVRDEFGKFGLLSALFLLPVLAAVVLLRESQWSHLRWTIGLGGMALYVAMKFWYVARRFSDSGLPTDYRCRYYLGSGLINIALAGLVIVMLMRE